MKNGCLIVLIMVIAILAAIFGVITGIYAVVCWAFGFTFTWPIAVAIWLVCCGLLLIFK